MPSTSVSTTVAQAVFAVNNRALTNHFTDTGANASAEEAEEGVEDTEIKVNNVVNSFRLQSTQFDKKSYLTHLKSKAAIKRYVSGHF